MKAKKIFIILLGIMVFLLPITVTYALGKEEQQTSFFEIEKREVTKEETIEMVIHVDKIKYDVFTFSLKASENIENVKMSNIEENISLEKEDSEIQIEIDKQITHLDTIVLYYQIPENLAVGDIIQFIASVTNQGKSTEQEDTNSIVNTEVQENNTEIVDNQDEIEVETIEIEVKIVAVEDNQNNEKEEQIKEPEENTTKKENISEEIVSSNEEKQSMAKTVSVGVVEQKKEQVQTYQGSDNSYLSELSVSGYSFHEEFSKENTTYFITVAEEVETLDVIASAEDDNAGICIYGNEVLSKETNKILISVTAENGEVRNYRIYVMKKS